MGSASALRGGLWLVLLGAAAACQPNVVDAVSEPPLGDGGDGGDGGGPSLPATPLETSLIHRYSFDEAGSEVIDSRFSAHGTAVNAFLPGDGTLPLAGSTSNQFVSLPTRLISGLGDATFEAWLSWRGGEVWQRIFDFGETDGDLASNNGGGISYLFLTTATPVPLDPALGPPAALRAAFSTNGVADETICHASEPFPIGVVTQVALVIDARAQSMLLYQSGRVVATCKLDRPLSLINDVNNWLGRSNYLGDAELAGIYHEFRIYGAALSAQEILASSKAGPEAGLE